MRAEEAHCSFDVARLYAELRSRSSMSGGQRVTRRAFGYCGRQTNVDVQRRVEPILLDTRHVRLSGLRDQVTQRLLRAAANGDKQARRIIRMSKFGRRVQSTERRSLAKSRFIAWLCFPILPL